MVAQEGGDVGLGHVEAQRLHGHLELVVVDPPVLVQVEQRERLVDLLALVLRQLRRCVGRRRCCCRCGAVAWACCGGAAEGVGWAAAAAEERGLRACGCVAARRPVEARCVGSRGEVGLVRGHFEWTRGMIEMWDGLRWS